jgi:hypothetical protein
VPDSASKRLIPKENRGSAAATAAIQHTHGNLEIGRNRQFCLPDAYRAGCGNVTPATSYQLIN